MHFSEEMVVDATNEQVLESVCQYNDTQRHLPLTRILSAWLLPDYMS